MNNRTISIRTLSISLLLAFASSAVAAADVAIGTAADIAGKCYAVGDTVTVSGGDAAAVLGDYVATLAGQTLTMKHAGFTLLKDAGGTECWFAVYEAPGGEGDVFLFDWTENSNYGWVSASWTNVTQNSARTYPDHADDVAMIRVARGDYGFLTVPASGVTVGQLIVGMTKNWTLDHTSDTITPLRFERTDGAVPRINLSRPVSSGDGDYQFRLGNYDQDNGGNVLDVSFTGKILEVNFCGDSVSAGSYVRMGALNFAFGRGRIQVAAGQTVRFGNGSRLTKNTDAVSLSRMRQGSGIFGAGTVEVSDAGFDLQSSDPDTYLDVGLFRSVTGWSPFSAENNVSRFTTRFNTVPSVPVEILSGRCPTNLNSQTWFRNYWPTGAGNVWLSPSVLLAGVNYEFLQNGEYAPHGDYLQATNLAEQVTLRGHVGFYTNPAYNPDGSHLDSDGVQRGRVSHHLRVKDLELFDRWTTAQANGFNFCRGDSRTNDIKGTITFDNWAKYVRRPAGVDPADYDGNVYAIIPWMTVHANDNNQNLTDNNWGQEQTFPAVRETDGCLRLVKTSNNLGTSTIASRGANDNFYFNVDGDFHLDGADRTVFSLVYHIGTTLNAVSRFYLDEAMGGHRLTVTSGAMAITRTNQWLGQPENMTRNGRIVLEGDPSYLHVPSAGLLEQVFEGNLSDYNMCWVPLVAANDLVKGGAGSIGLAGDQRGIQGVLAVNGGQLWLGYPAYKKNGYLYNYGNPTRGWPMHGCATDCDFRIRGGAVLALASAGYTGVDSDGNEVNEPVLANGVGKQHTITLERSGNAVGGIYIAEGVTGTVYEALYEAENGKTVTFARGTWGSSESAADHVDDLYFSGPGVLKVLHDQLANPLTIIVR
ncbi:MAG: hypothetical protein J6Q49_03010 [Kiritimatiellae bacterium]|nr:hypothetical protein [Kiritimatiellia bacterium]